MIGIIKAAYERDPEGFGYACLSYVLTLVVWALVPIFLLASYFVYYGFFSYDLLSEQVPGRGLFTIFALLTITSTSFFQVGFVVLWVLKKNKKSVSKGAFFLFGLTNLLVNAIELWFIGHSAEKVEWLSAWFVLNLTGLGLLIHLAILVSSKPKNSLISLAIVVFTVPLLTIHSPTFLAYGVGKGLGVFGVGGALPVEVELNQVNHSKKIEGELILLSPDYLYLAQDSRLTITTISRSSIATMDIESRAGRLKRVKSSRQE